MVVVSQPGHLLYVCVREVKIHRQRTEEEVWTGGTKQKRTE